MSFKRTYSIAEAKDHLPKVIREAEGGRAATLTRRGQPVAVILGVDEYGRLQGRARGYWQRYTRFVQKTEVGVDVDEFLKDLRDRSEGRDVEV